MTTALAIPILETMKATAGALTGVSILPLESDAEEAQAVAFLREIARLVKESEDERKRLVAPIKAQSNAIDAAFRVPRQELERVEKEFRARLGERESAREQARIAASKAALAAETPREANAALAVAPPPESPVDIGHRYYWSYEVEDITRVPAAYLSVSAAAVSTHVKAAEASAAEPSIPGLTFTRQARVVLR